MAVAKSTFNPKALVEAVNFAPKTFAAAKTVIAAAWGGAPRIVATIDSAIWPEPGGLIFVSEEMVPAGESGFLKVSLVQLLLNKDGATIQVLCVP
jgi:hypothetical protein